MSVLLKVILLSILADAQKAAVRAAEEEIAHAEAAEAARIEQKMVKEEQAHQKAVKDANAKKAKGEALSKEEAKLVEESEQASAGRNEASSTADGSSSVSRRGAKEESVADVQAAEAARKFEASNVGKVEKAMDKNAISKLKEQEAKDLEFNSKVREIKNQQAFKDMPDAIVEELSRKNVPVDHIQRNEVISLKPGEPKGTMYSYTNHIGEPVILELDAAGSVVSMKKASYKEIFNPKNYTKERMNSSNP